MQDLRESKEFKDWYSDSFERWINEGYRYFPANSIKLDIENRTLTFLLKDEEKSLWSSDFLSRVRTDTYFKNNFSGNLKDEFSKENDIFNLSKKTQNYNVEIWWRVAITETRLFLDKSWETYIAIPLAKWYETYSLSGKLTGAKIITWASFIDANKIISRIRKSEENTLFELQEKYKKDLIIKELESFKFWDWTVKFQIPGGKYSQLNNVHIWRASTDWAFEILSTKIYKTYENLLSSFNISENIWYDRAIALVKLSDLLVNEWWNLNISKIFYDWEEREISDLPDEFSVKFWEDLENRFIKDFTKTPSLEIFLWKIKTLLLQDEFKNTLYSIISDMQKERDFRKSQKYSKQAGENTENEILAKFWLEKNTQNFYLKWTKEDFINKLKKKNLSKDLENKLISMINSIPYNPLDIKINPDSIYKKNWKIYFIEIKWSSASIKDIQNRNLTLAKYLLEDIDDIIYLIWDYKWTYIDEFWIKRIWLEEIEGIWLENLE